MIEDGLVGHPSRKELGLGQVMIDVRVAHLPALVRRGSTNGLTRVDFAGLVRSVGPDVSHVAAGMRVCGFTQLGSARRTIEVEQRYVAAVPDTILDDEATVVASSAAIAYRLLSGGTTLAGLTVCVLPAACPVADAVCQIATASGATVTAVVPGLDANIARRLRGVWNLRTREQIEGASRFDVVVDLSCEAGRCEAVGFVDPGGHLCVALDPGGRSRQVSLETSRELRVSFVSGDMLGGAFDREEAPHRTLTHVLHLLAGGHVIAPQVKQESWQAFERAFGSVPVRPSEERDPVVYLA